MPATPTTRKNRPKFAVQIRKGLPLRPEVFSADILLLGCYPIGRQTWSHRARWFVGHYLYFANVSYLVQ